jgi:4-diphosphocytidyl-2C-methyl-D-erythritol kinase
MRGRGEMLDRLRPLRAQWLVLIVPGHTLLDKTRRLYAALESGDFSSGDATLRAAEGVRHNQSIDASACVNGFERAARLVFPGLDHLWREAEQVCERPFCLSGAGPALFAFARDRADARRQLQRVRHLATSVFAVRTVRAARATLKYARGNGIGYA